MTSYIPSPPPHEEADRESAGVAAGETVRLTTPATTEDEGGAPRARLIYAKSNVSRANQIGFLCLVSLLGSASSSLPSSEKRAFVWIAKDNLIQSADLAAVRNIAKQTKALFDTIPQPPTPTNRTLSIPARLLLRNLAGKLRHPLHHNHNKPHEKTKLPFHPYIPNTTSIPRGHCNNLRHCAPRLRPRIPRCTCACTSICPASRGGRRRRRGLSCTHGYPCVVGCRPRAAARGARGRARRCARLRRSAHHRRGRCGGCTGSGACKARGKSGRRRRRRRR
ncbi:hypothetical protein BC830DRAFT_514843 [Chytriomyces sp. MP71]|nr:hypothetical protein BC830DRAFT_514843 [Chytriomyces sp. MP71]